MKRIIGLLLVAMLAVILPAVTPDQVEAQDQVYVSPSAGAMASDIINGRILSTTSVEIDSEVYRLTEIEILSAPKGDLSGSIFVETPGGERADGTVVYVSHTPKLEDGELVQLALQASSPFASTYLPLAVDRDLPVYSISGGVEGAWGLLPDGVGRANAVGDYVLNGAAFADFDSAVNFRVNPQNSGVGSSGTIAAVRRGFQMWEDDPGSDIDFRYDGTSSKSGVNLGDDENTVSWVSSSSSWLAQANWLATQGGEILEFDIRISTRYGWANGASGGRWDIGSIVGHEVGHALGLTHVFQNGIHSPPASELMHWQVPAGRIKGFGSGDRSGVAFLYPGTDPICDGEPVTVNLSAGESPTQGADVIWGTNNNDVIDGLGGDDIICGRGGSDRIVGGAGNDLIDGGSGDDKLFGGPGDDEIRGGSGHDVIHGNRGDDSLSGGDGNDKIYGYADADTIWGGDGDDFLHGNRGDDKVYGGNGNDRVWGYADNDILQGQVGDDLVVGNFGDDVLYGGQGQDVLTGADGQDTLNGGPGNDGLHGNSGNDVLNGGQGSDFLDGGIDTDSCNGNADNDAATRCETVVSVP